MSLACTGSYGLLRNKNLGYIKSCAIFTYSQDHVLSDSS
jgi:hypothetical protein